MLRRSVDWDESDELKLAREIATEATKAGVDEELARHAFRCGLQRLSQALNVPASGDNGLTPEKYPQNPVDQAQYIVDKLLPKLSALAAERRERAALLWRAGHLCSAAAEAAEQAAPRK